MSIDIESPTQGPIDSRLFRLPQVEAYLGLRRAAIYQRIAAGLISPPIKLGRRASVWPAREIIALCEAHIEGRSDTNIRQLVTDLVVHRTRNV
jgi:prophage regulatory protein